MGNQQYLLHSNIAFIHPRKTVCTLAYPLNPTHGEIDVVDQQYQNNVYDYHLVKNMNSALKKTVVVAIDEQRIKRAKDVVMGYANKSFVEVMDWLYVRYGQITPVYLIQNQKDM